MQRESNSTHGGALVTARFGSVASKLTIALLLGLVIAGCGKSKTDTAREFLLGGQLEQAEEILSQEIEAHPDNAEAHFLMGWIHLQIRRDEREVEKYFTAVIILDEGYRDELFNLIMTYVYTVIELG